MKTLAKNIKVHEDDLDRVSNFLAGHYGVAPEQKRSDIINHILCMGTAYSIEIGGFIAVNISTNPKYKVVRVFVGNHLLRFISPKEVKLPDYDPVEFMV